MYPFSRYYFLLYFIKHEHLFFLSIVSFYFLNLLLAFHSFQSAIGLDIIDVTLIARRCTRRIGILYLILIYGLYHPLIAQKWLDIMDHEDLPICAGPRLWRRGADSDGFVANFVESEQIIQLKGFTASFVQVVYFILFYFCYVYDIEYHPVITQLNDSITNSTVVDFVGQRFNAFSVGTNC